MNLFLTFQIALRSLSRNKIRSGLTVLGIIIGIAAVIAVMAVGQGATVMIQSQISSLGENLLMVYPGSASTGGLHFGAGTNATLTASDGDAILKESHYVRALTPITRTGGQLVYKEKNWFSGIQGVAPDYPKIRNWKLEKGSFFADSDVKSANRICVIGATVAENLFEDENPVGKIIRIKNMPFRVIGVLEQKGSAAWGQDQDDVVVVPWTTVRRVLQNSAFNDVNQLLLNIDSTSQLESAKKEITEILRQRHHLAPVADNDFTINDMTELSKTVTETARLMTLLLAVIASISLLVGGIGIMNIMLVSVTERTREIGLRMAVGARGQDILLQFVVEAIVLSGIGGILGILIGSGTAELVARVYGWPVLVSAQSILLAFIFSTAVGVFFGFYPAWRASRLNPIEALRYE
ncbi:MAG: ABC transporter permease [Planctomycetota bacterium]